jgi:ABC-type dipeptide/oligopeptide/nickel transport system permease subunit
MLAFPVIALAIALIAIGRGGDKLFLEERRRDRAARRAMLVVGIVILVVSLATFFI